MFVIKRDGRRVPFDAKKIQKAVKSAFIACGTPQADSVYEALSASICGEITHENPSVEEIQDIVEKVLMREGYCDVAKAYILYRSDRSRVREMNTSLMHIYKDITYSDASDSNIKRENANIDGNTAMGTMLKYGSEGAKKFYDLYVLDPEFAKAHREGDIHIHDMDFYTLTTTCTQIDILKLFKDGFNTGHGFLREPNDVSSYAALACIAIQANQNDQHGGQAIVNFDYGIAPGVKKTFIKELCKVLAITYNNFIPEDCIETFKGVMKCYPDSLLSEEGKAFVHLYMTDTLCIKDNKADELIELAIKYTDKATYQAMEALIHNLNTMHSRAGAQVPFSSLNYGMATSEEARMVVKNLLLATESGLGNGETPIFPIQIFRVKEGINFNPKDPNYDLFKLACRCSAKRLFPNFSFQDSPFNAEYYKGTPETEISYMGCRTRVIGNTADPSKAISNGRGNLSFTTINLPRIAIESHGDLDKFYEELDYKIDLVARQLLHRYKIQCSKRVRNYPFLMGNGVWIDSDNLSADDTLESVLKHGTLSVGFIGLAETLVALTGKHHGEDESIQQLGLDIIQHMRDEMDFLSKKFNLNFTLLATPAEGLSGRFVKIDRQKYGSLKGITDREYYTNSFHIPVYYPISAAQKIKLEAPYHAMTNAGHITYVELDGDPMDNLEAFEQIVRYMHDCGIGYGSINHPVDRDPICGYTGIIHDECPHCGRKEDEVKFDRIRRITGYLVGTTDRWNNAKQAEERDRVKHQKVSK